MEPHVGLNEVVRHIPTEQNLGVGVALVGQWGQFLESRRVVALVMRGLTESRSARAATAHPAERSRAASRKRHQCRPINRWEDTSTATAPS